MTNQVLWFWRMDECLSHIVDFFSPMEAGSGHGGVPIAAVGYSHSHGGLSLDEVKSNK